MELILKEDVKGLGYKNDIVTVRPGFGRNFLIPQGYALLATESNRKQLAETQRQVSHKAEKIKTAAVELAAAIGNSVLTIKAKAGEGGRIFGAVTTLQLSDALRDRGFDVDRKRISFETEVKLLGEYVAVLNLHKEVSHKVNFVVSAD
jgi:large subunit ribosomal protein L9